MHERILEKRFNNLKEHEQKLLEEHGWVVHYVYDQNGELNGHANIHTHGLFENFNHMDLQVTLPIAPETIHPVLSGIVSDIKKGKVIKPDVRNKRVLKGMDVVFRIYKEGNRDVLRLFIPDPNGKLPFEKECDPTYQRQIEEVPEYKG